MSFQLQPSCLDTVNFSEKTKMEKWLTRTSTFRKNDILVVPLTTELFRYRELFNNEKEGEVVDGDINLPEERHPCRSTCNRAI